MESKKYTDVEKSLAKMSIALAASNLYDLAFPIDSGLKMIKKLKAENDKMKNALEKVLACDVGGADFVVTGNEPPEIAHLYKAYNAVNEAQRVMNVKGGAE